MRDDKHSFVLYTEYMRPLSKLNMDQRGQVLTALMAYTDGTELPDMDQAAEIAFEFIANQIDADTEKWEATKEARAKAGSKGGQTTQANASKNKQTQAKTSKSKQNETNQAVNVNVNVNDNVINKKDNSPEPSSEPAAITLPLNTGAEHPITAREIEDLKKLYPAVDVMQELRNMRGWCMGNPSKRKTASGINRFIHNWLSGEQNKGNRTTRAAPAKKGDTYDQRAYDYADLEASLTGGAT